MLPSRQANFRYFEIPRVMLTAVDCGLLPPSVVIKWSLKVERVGSLSITNLGYLEVPFAGGIGS